MRKNYIYIMMALMFVIMLMPFVSDIGYVDTTNRDVDIPIYKDILVPVLEEQSVPSDGGNWLAGWGHRQGINITGSALAGTNYQMQIFVNYDAAGDAGEINCSSQCQTDFDDIRFTDDDGDTLLDYFMEEYTDSDDATFWVEVADDLSSNQAIYIYYENAAATTSNGTNTFIFFDDFENNNLNKWDDVDANHIENSIVYGGSHSVHMDGSGGESRLGVNFTIGAVTYGILVHCVWYSNTTMRPSPATHIYNSDLEKTYAATQHEDDTTPMYHYNGTWNIWPGSADIYSEFNWYEQELGFDQDGADPDMRLWMAGSYIGEDNQEDWTGAQWATQNIKRIDFHSQNLYKGYLDDVWVRRWCVTEPALGVVAAEEDEPAGANNVPVNEGASLTNADDADNLYAMYKSYIFVSNVSDADGWDEIVNVSLTFIKDETTPLWTLLFDATTETYSESLDTNNYITLQTASCSNSSSGTKVNITWSVLIHWNHTDYSDFDLNQTVFDSPGDNDADNYFALNYDVETRLNMDTFGLEDGTGTVDRGDYNSIGSIDAQCHVVYYGGTKYPLATEVDVWTNCSHTPTTSWNMSYVSGTGLATAAVDSDDVVGLDTYYFVVVEEGDGANGVNLCANLRSDTYIADAYTITFTVADHRININTNATVGYTVISDYDAKAYDGTVTLNYSTWTQAVVGRWNFTVSSLGGDDTDGVSVISTNDEDYVIWDSVTISAVGVADNRVNVSSNATITITAVYDYDGAAFDGTFTMNDTTYDYDYVGRYGYTVTSLNGDDTYGITVISANADNYVIFDAIEFRVWGSNIAAVPGVDISVYVILTYCYDHTNVTDGTVELNGTAMAYNGTLWKLNVTQGVAGVYLYNITSISGNANGITILAKGPNYYWNIATFTWDSRFATGDTLTFWFMVPTGQAWGNIIIMSGPGSTEIIKFVAANQMRLWIGGLDRGILTLSFTLSNGVWYYLTMIKIADGAGSIDVYINSVYEGHFNVGVTGFFDISWLGDTEIVLYDVRLYNATWSSTNRLLGYYGYFPNNPDIWFSPVDFYLDSASGRWYCNSTGNETDAQVRVSLTGEFTGFDEGAIYLRLAWTEYVNFTFTMNMTWTVVSYYVMMSWTAYYDIGLPYDGTFVVANYTTVTNDYLGNDNITKTTTGNYTFYVTSITDPLFGLTLFNTNTSWCVWDNVTGSVIIAPGAEIGGNIPYTIFCYNLTWAVNGTFVSTFWDFMHIDNGTLIITVDSDGNGFLIPPMWMVVQPETDDAWVYSNNTTATIDGRLYNFTWYTSTAIIVAAGMEIIVEADNTLEDTQVVSGTTNVDFNWTVYEENVALPGETGTFTVVGDVDGWVLEWDLTKTVGQHNYSILFNTTSSGHRWFNSSYYYGFELNIDPPEVKGDVIEVRGTTTLTCDWWIYAEGVYDTQTGSVSPSTFSFFFTKKSTAGLHNYSIKFNVTATTYIWKNGSYYVPTDWDTAYISLYGQNAIGLDPLMFKIYVNGTRVWSLNPQFYNRTDYAYNITILNFLNETISSTTYSWARFIDISVDVYTLFVYSQLEEEFIYFNLTSTAGATWTGYVPPRGHMSVAVFASTDYIYAFSVLEGGKAGVFGGTINIDADYGIIINAYNLMDIYRGIQNIGGGAVTPDEVLKAYNAVYAGPLGQIQFFSWLTAILMFLGLYVIPYVRKGTGKEEYISGDNGALYSTTPTIIHAKPKQATPKQLKQYEFQPGHRPVGKTVPVKGQAMKDMGDEIWGKLKKGHRGAS